MKKIVITALVSMLAVGTASADFTTDIQVDAFYGQSTETNLTQLPATAAGRDEEVKQYPKQSGMQDHPRERLSGI